MLLLVTQLALSLMLFSTSAIAQTTPLRVAGQDVELAITEVSGHTVRITFTPKDMPHTLDASPVLVPRTWSEPALKATALPSEQTIGLNHHRVTIKPAPLTIEVAGAAGKLVERLTFDMSSAGVSFRLGNRPSIGFRRRRLGVRSPWDVRRMNNGHRADEYQIFGSRVPIPFLIGLDQAPTAAQAGHRRLVA